MRCAQTLTTYDIPSVGWVVTVRSGAAGAGTTPDELSVGVGSAELDVPLEAAPDVGSVDDPGTDGAALCAGKSRDEAVLFGEPEVGVYG